MSSPAYLDFRDALDHLAPPEAVKINPAPVVVLAQLNQLADQIFEPRAWIEWSTSLAQAQLFIRPVAQGGLLIQNLEWTFPAATCEVAIQSNTDADPMPAVLVDQLQVGGPTTRFLFGMRVGGDFGGMDVPEDGSLPGSVFVAPGFTFRIGVRSGPANNTNGRGVIREIPITPMGY